MILNAKIWGCASLNPWSFVGYSLYSIGHDIGPIQNIELDTYPYLKMVGFSLRRLPI